MTCPIQYNEYDSAHVGVKYSENAYADRSCVTPLPPGSMTFRVMQNHKHQSLSEPTYYLLAERLAKDSLMPIYR